MISFHKYFEPNLTTYFIIQIEIAIVRNSNTFHLSLILYLIE